MTALLTRYLVFWHGRGTPAQAEYYRCRACRGLVTWHRIRAGGCRCGGSHVQPAALSWREKARLLLFPWSVR